MEKAEIKAVTRVGLVSAHPLRLLGLEALMGDRPEIEVIGLSVPRALDTQGLQVILIDSTVTEHLFELLEAFRRDRPQLRLIVMGVEKDFAYIEQVIGAGAKGFLNQSASEAELKMAIDVVRDGSVWAPRKVLARLLERPRESSAQPQDVSPSFTKREKEVLELLAKGHPNREIAIALGVDEGSIKAHLGRLMRKVGVENRTALAMRTADRSSS